MSDTPHKCPVCGGTGNVPSGFYLGGNPALNALPVTCRSCFGTGVLWKPVTKVDTNAKFGPSENNPLRSSFENMHIRLGNSVSNPIRHDDIDPDGLDTKQ